MVSPCEWGECKLKFAHADHLVKHVQRHVDELRLLDDDLICFWRSCSREKNKPFKRPYELVNHLRRHTHERPYECDICQQKCSTKQMLDRHSYTHGGQPRFKCDGCGKMFALSSERLKCQDRHINRTYPCPDCRKVFRDKGSLRRHKRAWGHGAPADNAEVVHTALDKDSAHNSVKPPSDVEETPPPALPDKPNVVPVYSQNDTNVHHTYLPLLEGNSKMCILVPVLQTSACNATPSLDFNEPITSTSGTQSNYFECVSFNLLSQSSDRSQSLPNNSIDMSTVNFTNSQEQNTQIIHHSDALQAEDLSPVKYYSFDVSQTPLNMSQSYECDSEPVLTDLTLSTSKNNSSCQAEDLSPLKYYQSVDMHVTPNLDMYYKCSQESIDASLMDLTVDHCSHIPSRMKLSQHNSYMEGSSSLQSVATSMSSKLNPSLSDNDSDYMSCKYLLLTNDSQAQNNFVYLTESSGMCRSEQVCFSESNPVNLTKCKNDCLSSSLLDREGFLTDNSVKFEDKLPPISSFSSSYTSLGIDHLLNMDSCHTYTESSNFQLSKDGALDLTGEVEDTLTTLHPSHTADNFSDNLFGLPSSNRCGAIDLSRHETDPSAEQWMVESGFSFTNLLNSPDPLDLSISVVDACRNWDVSPWLNQDLNDRS